MIRGILPVIPTLFRDDGDIDPDAVRQVVKFAIHAGAHGVVFPGVASEYNFLSVEERGELMSAVHDEVGGRVPIVGGASAATSEQAVIAGQHAMNHGINHLMIMAPHGLGDDLDAHHQFFSIISQQLQGAEIILQNAPRPIGAGLDAASIIALASANRSITYIKEETLPSGPTITALIAANIPHLQGILGGGGARYIIDELDRGALGALPAVELTDIHVSIYDAHRDGDDATARELYRATLPLLVCQAIYRMRLTKYVLMRRGICDRQSVRAPLPELDAHARKDVDAMIAELNRVQQ